MSNFKEKRCKLSGVIWKQFNSLQKCQCEECRKLIKPPQQKKTYSIPKVSDKRKIDNLKYTAQRIVFLGKPENQICFIEGCNRKANTIEHRAGRWGKNFLDETTWAGCCSEHNIELENNPEMAKKYQLSKITGKEKQ